MLSGVLLICLLVPCCRLVMIPNIWIANSRSPSNLFYTIPTVTNYEEKSFWVSGIIFNFIIVDCYGYLFIFDRHLLLSVSFIYLFFSKGLDVKVDGGCSRKDVALYCCVLNVGSFLFFKSLGMLQDRTVPSAYQSYEMAMRLPLAA